MTGRARPEVEVDFLPDPDDAAPADPASPPRRSGRWWWVAAVVLVAVLGVSELVERGREARREERWAATPGLVADLSTPPRAAWGTGPGYVLGATDEVVILSTPVRATTAVVALEVTDGSVRWSHRLDGADGPQWCSLAVTAGVLCWRVGELGERAGELVVLSADTGEVIGRQGGVMVQAQAVAVPDGVVVVRAGEGADALVRLDPVTGEVGWEVAVPVPGAEASLDAVVAVGELVALIGARTLVVDPGTGEVLAETARSGVVAVPGGFAVRTGQHRWRVFDTAGTVLGEVPGRPAEPELSDGSVPEVLVVTDGARHRAVDRSGRERWSLPDDHGLVVARREGAVVMLTGTGVTAIDLRSGRERWVWSGDLCPECGAVSDGGRLVVVGRGGADEGAGGGRWVGHAIDLDTGETAWTAGLPVPWGERDEGRSGRFPRIEAVAGRAYAHTGFQASVWWEGDEP